MPTTFRTTRRVEFVDTDMAGMAHFSNFFRWMEAAEVEFLRSLGLSVALEWDGQKISFPRVAAACDYSRPALFEEVVDIAVRVEKIGRSSVTYGFEFTRAGEVLARGRVSSVCCRVEPGRPPTAMALPPPLREKLEQACA